MERDDSKVIWVNCPHCGSKIGIFLAVEEGEVAEERVEAPREALSAEERVRRFLQEEGVDMSLIKIEEEETQIVISPMGYIGDPWGEINDKIRQMGGEWISAGRESRWIIKKEDLQV